jgi:threonine/homoserine/homoserine lactone efflux protein
MLVSSYSVLVILVHTAYALLASSARGWLATKKGSWLAGKLSGITFFCFGLLMASSTK